MRTKTIATYIKWIVAAMLICLVGGTATAAFADVSPGDVIDKSNWQKIQGMVPDPVLEYVKNGEFVLNIGTLNLDPKTSYPEFAIEANKKNVGKYEINSKQEIVEKATGKAPSLVGLPFPNLDPNVPMAAEMALYNAQIARYLCGNVYFANTVVEWIGQSGFEKKVSGIYQSAMYVGSPETRNIQNPNGFEYQNIITITSPYDVAGTAVMLWRYKDERPDTTYGYIPAIRRVRRMSSASRSDAFLGSDMCLDDTAGYDGKISAFNWKVVKTQDALIPYISGDYQKMERRSQGEGICDTKDLKRVNLGYETKGWEGAPWAMTNIIYVKRKIFIIEGKPKDPYYNYGTTYLWMDAENYNATYKVILDRANIYWKTVLTAGIFYSSEDGSYKSMEYGGMLVVDDKKKHATYSRQRDPDDPTCWQVRDMNLNNFTLGGFQKVGK